MVNANDIVFLAYGKFGSEAEQTRLLGVYKTQGSAEAAIIKQSDWGFCGLASAGHVELKRILE